MRSLLPYFFLALPFFAQTQGSNFSLIYELSNEAYEEKVRAKTFELTPEDCQALVGSTDALNWNHHPAAYYIKASVIGEQLELSILDKTSIHAVLLNNERDFAVQILDESGQLVQPAKVWLNKKEVPYDKTTKSYRLIKRKRAGVLKVEAKGQVLLYEIDNRKLYNYRNRFLKTLINIVALPYYIGRRIFYYFQRGFDYGDWHIRLPRVVIKSKSLKGYIATNQPIYQHGDTLKMKAYVAQPNGKPWKGKLNVDIYSGYYNNYLFQKEMEITPDENGNIIYEMYLADSMAIDKDYTISINTYRRIRDFDGLRHSFKLEDYQLDEVKYEFSSEKDEYEIGEKIVLSAEGKDQNGFTITDGTVKIVATADKVRSILDTAQYIPDTLWTTEQDLSARTATQLIFPDSLLPKADMDIQIQATFTNSNGELHEKKRQIKYGSDMDRYELKLENGQVIANHFFNQKEQTDSVFLMTKFEHKSHKKKIKLPYEEKLNPYASRYFLKNEKDRIIATLKYSSSKVEVFGNYKEDSVQIRIQNPCQIPVNYWIYRADDLLLSGQTDSINFYWAQLDESHKTHHIRYQYAWEGKSKFNTTTIQHYKNQLSIIVEEPEEVIPSQQVQIKVKVADSQKRSVPNVNLTAAALNAQFKSSGSLSDLQIEHKKPNPLKRYATFSQDKNHKYDKERFPITKNWYEKFNLDQQLFYRLRFSEQIIHKEYIDFQQDSFYQKVAQFAPYVIENGKSVPVFMIYCNRNLVYYYETDNNTPYSFAGKKGYNSIVLRTRDREYQIDSVLLKKGQKLEFSIQAKKYHTNITKRIRPDSLTKAERNLLKDRIFILRREKDMPSTYLWQDTFSIHYFSATKYKQNSYSYRDEPLLFGPFYTQKHIQLLQPSHLGAKFAFEPGFEYEIESRRERLYHSNHFNRKMVLPKYGSYKIPMDSLIKPSRLRYQRRPKINGTRLSKTYENVIKKGGSFEFTFQDSLNHLVAIALKDDTASTIEQFVPSLRSFSKLSASTYTLLLVNQDFQTYRYSFEVKKDTLLFTNISYPSWQNMADSTLQKWFPSDQIISSKEPFLSLEEKVLPVDYLNSGEIRGQITDVDGEPLIGASVFIRGTTLGTVTDLGGYYTLLVPDEIKNPIVVVSYTGFASQEILVTGNGQVDAILAGGVALDEVVVVGFGVARVKQDNTTIGRTITSEEIRRLPTRNINALKATTAGLASADEGENISVRGSRSNSTDYYIDGIRVSGDLALEAEINFAASGIRSNFQDYAYWNPNLMTDQNGEAYFTVTYPDNITSWNTFVVGMDRKLRAGVAYGNTRSYKPLLAQLATPRFLVEGDESNLIGKAVNYTNDTLSITTKFELEGKEIQNNSTDLIDGFVEIIKVNAPEQSDSLHFQYQLQMGDYFDGEKRSIPVVRRGMEAVKGTFQILDQDTTLVYEPLLQSGEVNVFVESNFLNSALRSLDYLVDYPYGCNEQTASRLLGLLMKKKIYAKLEKPFEQEEKIAKMVQRLEKTQNTDGSWGWWRGNKTNNWMSVYVTKVLQIAATEGYPTAALKKGLDHLALNTNQYNQRLQMDALMILAQSNVPFNFENHLARYDSSELNLYERLATIRMRQILNQEYHLDSLYHYQKRNTFGSTYWQQSNRYWYDRSNQPTLLAYQILKVAGKKEELKSIRQWFFQQRGRYIASAWMNTYQTATILETILPEILAESSVESIQNDQFKINGDTIMNFPYQATFSSNQTLSLEKKGSTPVFFTAYQRCFETQPKRKDSLFDITSTLLQEGKKVSKLEQGKRVQLKVTVEVKEAAEYIMIEIPILAACSYHSKPNGWKYPEVHREYFKEKTAIFCRKLEAGEYEFELDLEARFTGKYTINPVRVEQMYFPVFDGNNELKRVVVK